MNPNPMKPFSPGRPRDAVADFTANAVGSQAFGAGHGGRLHASLRHATLLALLFSFVASCVSVAAPPAPPPPPDAPPFYEELAPHGDWWWHDRWGWIYSPWVDVGWRPYTVGHWAWADDDGWLWVSQEPFGWACHHYGRWLWLDDAGWVWVPGGVWAPAWVEWRYGPGFIGWAPLGPDAVWVRGRGFVDADSHMGPWGWVFVDEPDFVIVNIVTVVHSHARNVVILPTTRVIHRPERGDNDRVVNRGIDREIVERATGKRVVSQRVVVDNADPGGHGRPREPAKDDTPEVIIRRQPEIERNVRDRDVFGPRATVAPAAELRPLRAPDVDIENRFQDERRRTLERHQQERALPTPPAVDLRRRQEQELDEMEKAKEKEKNARDKKKVTPRKVYPKKKAQPHK